MVNREDIKKGIILKYKRDGLVYEVLFWNDERIIAIEQSKAAWQTRIYWRELKDYNLLLNVRVIVFFKDSRTTKDFYYFRIEASNKNEAMDKSIEMAKEWLDKKVIKNYQILGADIDN